MSRRSIEPSRRRHERSSNVDAKPTRMFLLPVTGIRDGTVVKPNALCSYVSERLNALLRRDLRRDVILRTAYDPHRRHLRHTARLGSERPTAHDLDSTPRVGFGFVRNLTDSAISEAYHISFRHKFIMVGRRT